MKPAPFAYHAPSTIDEAVGLLAQLDDSKILAGGQSLMPMLAMRYVVTSHVVDLNGVRDLAFIRETPAGFEIGAMTRQRDLMRHEGIARRLPIIAEALQWVGHFQTRNRGTIGGSLSHLDPSAELVTLCRALDATLTVRSADGERKVPMAEWPLAYMMPSLAPGEVLARIDWPTPPAGTGQAFVEFARRHGDFAICCVAALVSLGADGRIAKATIAIGGIDPAPVRLTDAEQMLAGRVPDAGAFAEAGKIAKGVSAMSDAYVSGAYRQRLAGILVERAVKAAAERAGART